MLRGRHIILLGFLVLEVTRNAWASSFPKVIFLKGHPKRIDKSFDQDIGVKKEQNSEKLIKFGDLIQSDTVILTGPKDEVRLQVGEAKTPTAKYFLQSSSLLQIVNPEKDPIKRAQVDQVHFDFILGEGKILASGFSDIYTLNLVVKEMLPSEVAVEFDASTAGSRVQVIQGRVEIQGLGQAENLVLIANQKAGFQGKVEEGQAAFDILMQGKKVAKGQLTPIETLKVVEKKQLVDWSKTLQYVPPPPKKVVITWLCEKPKATYNQCTWNQETSKLGETICVQRRCLADGHWGEPTEMPYQQAESLCQNQRVGNCSN